MLATKPMINASDVEIAWAAGLFEGEGSVSSQMGGVKKNRRYFKLSLQMTDEDVVRRFASIVGSGNVVGPYTRNKPSALGVIGKPYWIWSLGGFKAIEIVSDKRFSSHLGVRRSNQVSTLLKKIEQNPPYVPALKSHCPYGHPYDKRNVQGRYCGECNRIRVRASRTRGER